MIEYEGMQIDSFVRIQDSIGQGFGVNVNWKVQLKTKILWDFTIQCDYLIEARRPDTVVIDKVKKETVIMYVIKNEKRSRNTDYGK